MTKLALFIEGVEVDLFKDEIVTVNSAVANVQDISKVFSDFSQSFLVPASPRNNDIFEHWYESDVVPTIDQNLRRDAFIEIEMQTFRTGKIQMNEAIIKNGQVVSYSLNFFGALVSLKDRFAEFTLANLDYSSLNFTYDGQAVQDRVEDGITSYDIRFPLVSPKRFWNDIASNANNIFEATKGISFRELFPAVRVSKIFELIESQFGLTFNSSFFNSKRWTDLYFRNQLSETFIILTNKHLVGYPSASSFSNFVSINTATSEIIVNEEYRVEIAFSSLTMSSVSSTLFVEVFKNEVLFSTTSISAGTTFKNLVSISPSSATSVYKIVIYSDETITVNVNLQFKIFYDEFTDTIIRNTVDPINLVVNDISGAFSSNLKIADFFSAILRAFNLVCEGIDLNTFKIEPLQDWYSLGKELDITTDVINSSGIKRMPIFKQITFEYKQSKSFANRNFLSLFNREYGNLNLGFNYDGAEFKIDLPFENNQFLEITGKNVFCGYCLDENSASYIPEPMLLYLSGEETASTAFKFKKESTEVNVTTYAVFNSVNTTGFSLCFGNEFNIVTQETEPNSLYNTYYANHLGNLYNLQQRLFSFTAYLPTGVISALRLNDKLIIKDKRYLINDMVTTLNNGEVKFNLLLDLEPIVPCSECFVIKFFIGEIEYSIEVNLAGQENGFNYYEGVSDGIDYQIIWVGGSWLFTSNDGEELTTIASIESFSACPPFALIWNTTLDDFVIAPCYVFDCEECVVINFDITVDEITTNFNSEMIWDGTQFNGTANGEFLKLIYEDGEWNLYGSGDNVNFVLVATASAECECPQDCATWTISELYISVLTNFTATSCE